MMKKFIFKRTSNDFTDILTDTNIRKHIRGTITYFNHLILNLENDSHTDKVCSYIVLMYGDDLINSIVKDRAPVPNVDYKPKKILVDGHYVDNK